MLNNHSPEENQNPDLLVPIQGIDGLQNPYGLTLDGPQLASSLLNPSEELKDISLQSQAIAFDNHQFSGVNSISYSSDSSAELNTGFGLNQYDQSDILLSGGSKEIAFVDGGLDNYQNLIAGFDRSIQVVVLDSRKNELNQISEFLGNQAQNYDAIHIFTHGSEGQLFFGNTVLNEGDLANYQSSLSILGDSLKPSGDLLLYGCKLANGVFGQDFLQSLSRITGADVAASTDLTGNFALGGDWNLEYATGKIETRSLSNSYYQGVFGDISYDFTGTTGKLELKDGAYDVENVYISYDPLTKSLVINDTDEQIKIMGEFNASNPMKRIDANTVSIDLSLVKTFNIFTDKDAADGDRVNIDLSKIDFAHKFDLMIEGDRYDDALNFTGNVSTFGGKIEANIREININQGVKLSTVSTSSNSGNITLKGKEININDSGQLLANASSSSYQAGDINIEGTKFWLPGADFAQFMADLGLGGSFDNSHIIVGKNAIFTGNNINLSTDTGGTTELASLIQDFPASSIRALVDLIVGIPVMTVVKKAESIISIGNNSQITASGNVNIESYANSNIDINVVGGDSEADVKFAEGTFLKKFSFGLGVGITKAETTIGDGVIINAGKNVSILADSLNETNVASRTSQNLGIKPTSKDNKAIAFGISYSEANAYATVGQGANITAGGNANVLATGNNYNQAAGRAYIYDDGTAGMALGLEISKSDIKTEVNGTIKAQGSANDIIISLDDNNLIDNATSKITLPQAHNFKTGDAVLYNDGGGSNDAIGGLVHENVYYVIVESSTQIKLAESRTKALAKQAIAIDKDDKSGTGHHLHALKGLGTVGVGIKANLESTDIVVADAGIFNDTLLNKIINFDTSAVASQARTWRGDKLGNASEAQAAENQKDLDAKTKAGDPDVKKPSKTSKLSQKAFPGKAGTQGTSSQWGLAGALAVTVADHNVNTKIGANAQLESGTDLEVGSYHQSITQTEAITALEKAKSGTAGPSKETAISASVSVGFYASDVKTEIGDGAQLDAKRNLTLESKIIYPFAWENADLTDISVAASASEVGTWWQNFITGKETTLEGVNSTVSIQGPHKLKPWSSWTKSASQADQTGISGSINVLIFKNNNQTLVGSGVKINQKSAYRDPNQSVLIQANTDLTLINITGDPLGLVSNSSGGKGVGGSVFFLMADNNTEAIVKDGALIYSGVNKKTTIQAKSKVFSTAIALSGGSADEFGISGTVVVNLQYNRTFAQLGSGAVVRGGGLDVLANDEIDHWNFVGAVIKGGNTGIGVSVGVHDIGRDVEALIGNSRDLDPGSNTNIDVNGDINVKAVSEGDIYTLSLAAAVVTQPKPDGSKSGPTEDATPGMSPSDPSAEVDDPIDISLIDKSTETGSPTDGVEKRPETPEAQKGTAGQGVSNDKGNQGKSGIGISGDVSIHVITDNAFAYINSTGNIRSAGNVAVKADNDTNLFTISGSASFVNKPGASSTGIAGSVAVNIVSGETTAYISGKNATTGSQLTLNANSLAVEALRTGDIFSISAGGSGAAGSQGTAIAGSVSVNNITNRTKSYIDGAVLVLLNDLFLKARDESDIFAIAGAIAYGGRAGVGAAIGVNIINNHTIAKLNYSTLSYGGQLQIKGENASEIQALSGAIGASSGNLGGAGTVSVNIINGETSASIDNSQKAVGAVIPTGLILVQATNNASIQSLSGAIGVSKGMGFGAAVGYNGINDTTEAYISGSTLATTNTLTVAANSDRTIQTMSLGLAGGKNLALAGSASVNMIDGSLKAYIANSTVTANGKVEVSAIASDDIEALAGAVGISLNNGGVGAAIGINQISNGNRAYILGSNVTTQSDLNIKSLTNSEISSITIGAAGAKTFALGGSISVNTIDNSSEASIEGNSQIQAGNVNLTGQDNSSIESLAGAVGLSASSAAIAASVAVNYISNRAKAYIDSSKVNSTGIFTLNADASSTIKSLSVSGAVSGGSAAVSGSFSINLIGGGSYAYISNGADVTALGVNIFAKNNSQIQSLAGNVSATGGSAAVGLSLAVNDLDNGIYAYIDNSKVTATNNQISLSANSTADIESASVGGSGAGTAAVGGSVSINIIDTATKAYVANNSILNAGQLISITANDNSDISSIAGQVSVGGTAGIGASVSTNYISNVVNAYISGSQVTSVNNGLNIQAAISPTVENITVGGAAAGTFAFGGSVTVNYINTQTLAYISNNSTIKTLQNVNIFASNDASIRSLAGQVSGAGSAAIGAAVAVNNSNGTTAAYITDSSVTSGGAVKISATETNSIESLSAGASVAGGAALTGSVSVNNLGNTIAAYTNNSAIATNTLEITAKNDATIKSLAGQFSGSGSVAVGASVAYNNIGNTVKAYSLNSQINAQGNVLINADGKGNIETIAVGGSIGGLVGLAGSSAVNEMSNNVSAYIQGGTLYTPGTVGAIANSVNSMKTYGGTLAAGAVGVGATIAVNNLNNTTEAYLRDANVTALGNNTLTVPLADGTGNSQAMAGLAVIATSDENLEVIIGTASAGIGALAGSIAVNSFKDNTQAFINGGTINGNNTGANSAQSLFIKAFNDSTVSIKAGAGAVGLGGGIGASIDVTTVKNGTSAFINNANVNIAKDLTVTATTQKDVTSFIVAAAGGGIGVAGAVSVVNVSAAMSGDSVTAAGSTQSNVSTELGNLNNMGKDASGKSNIQTKQNITSDLSSTPVNIQGTTAFIAGNINIGGNIQVIADETTDFGITAGAGAAGLVGVGGAVGIGNITHNTSAYVGANANIAAGGNIEITAIGLVDSSHIKSYAGAAGLVGLGAAVSNLTSNNNTSAYIASGAKITQANNIDLQAGSSSSVSVEGWGAAVGAAAVGVVIADAKESGTTQAYIGNGVQIQNANNVNVNATVKEAVSAVAQAAAGGIISGSGAVPTATVSPTVKAYIGDNANIQATNDVKIVSDVTVDGDADAKGVSVGVIAVGAALAEVKSNPNIDTHIGSFTTIDATNVTVQGRLGAPIATGDTSFDPSVAVNNSQDTIKFNSAHGLQTGDQVVYINGGGTDIAGLTNQSNYNVIVVDSQTVKLGSTFNAAEVDVKFNTIKFAQNHGFKDGDKVVYEATGGNVIGGLVAGQTYYVKVVDSKTLKLNTSPTVVNFTYITDNASNQVTVVKHGLNTGDRVVYKAMGQNALGGLTTGNYYYVIRDDIDHFRLASSLTNAQSGIGINLSENNEQHQLAPATTQGTDLANINTTAPDTVITINNHGFQNGDQLNYQQRIAKFSIVDQLPDTGGKDNIFNLGQDVINNNTINSASHGFENDDKVVYISENSSLGGLVNNATYYIINKTTNTFQLSATKGGTAIDITNVPKDAQGNVIDSNHQIKAVALKIQQVNQYNFSYATDNVNNQITLNNHGFSNNQAVVYKTSGVPLPNLIAGNTYYIKVVNANSFQLSSTLGGPVIDLGANGGTHQLIVNLGVQDLLEGVPYYVVGATANTFKLATTLGGTAVTLDKTNLTGTGLDHLFSKESVVDLTTVGTGTQNLHIDLDNSTATGSSHLLSSGANATIPSQGDNKFSAYSQAAAGALLGGTATAANLNITSNMTTYVGNNASITAKGNVTVDSLSSVQVTGSTTSVVVGAIAVGGSQINVNLSNQNTTYLGDLSSIKADGNVLINGETAQTINVSGEGGAGSLITFADAEAHINLTYNNNTYIGSYAQIIAKNDLTVNSNSNTDGKAKAEADGIGFYADADAESTFNVDGSNLTDIRQNAYLEGRTVNIQSLVDKLNVEARSDAEGAGLIGNIDAHAHVNLTGTDNNVNIGAGSYIKGDYINLDAIFNNVTSNAIALADCLGLGGDTDSNTSNNMPLTAKVWTDSTSTLEVYKLDVTSDFTNFNKTTRSHSDLAWSITIWTPFGDITITLDFGTEWEKETFAPTPIIDFNSNVKLLTREANPILIVDSNGNIIQQSDNVTATITNSDVIVGDIDNTGVGEVNFIIPSRSSEMSSNGKFTDKGKYTIIDPAYDTVQIENYSDRNLIINDISVINPGGIPPINYDVNVSSKTIAPNGPTLGAIPVNPTIVTINNWGNSDLILQGVIDNPHDRTFIYSTDNIFVNGTAQNIITRDLTMTAVNGSIGTNTQSINAQLNQGYSPVTADVPSHKIYLEAIAQGSVFLNLTAKQLDTNPVTVNVEKMTATTGEVNININQTTNKSGSNVTALYDFSNEYNLDDTKKADSNIIAGTNITINAGITTTNINGRTDFLGNGLLDVITGGYINLTELNGGVNLYRAISDQDYITLTVTESALTGEDLLLVDNAVVEAAKDVTFLVGDNFEITPTATITAGGNVLIKGDDGNKDTEGTLVNIYGWIYAQSMSIYGESNKDTFNIRRLATRTNLWAGGDDDIINVGSNQPLFNGTLDEIIKSLTVHGEGQNNRDILNIDDGGDTSNNIGILTNKSLTGLDMGEGIFYDTFELFNLTLGTGNDNLTVLNTGATTNITDLVGNNTFRFGPKLDSSGNVLAETMDGLLTQGQNILGTSNLTNLITGNGNDFIQVNRNTALLNIQSGNGDDTLEVNTPILNSTLLSNAQVNFSGDGGNDTAIANGSTVSETITTNGLSVNIANSRTIGLSNSETLNINGNTGNDTVNIDTVAGSNVTALNVSGNAGSDVINLYSLLSTITTTLNGNSENDIFNLGSQGIASPTLNQILGKVTMAGGDGTDTVNFKDDLDSSNNTGILTSTTLTGLGLGNLLTYNTLETMNLNLGTGNDTLTVQSTHTGVTNIKANSGNDQINIQGNSGDTFVWLGAGDDTLNVGSFQPVTGGKLNQITKKLTVYGETHTTGDTLNIDNSGDTVARTGVLTKDSLTGLGMAVGISYNTIETLNINLGSGADTFTTLDTGAVTNLNTGDGNDQVRIGPKLDADGVPLAEVNPALAANLINGNSFAMTVNTGKGDDAITVNRNTAALTLQGGDGNDNIQLNTASDRQTGLLSNGAVTLDGGTGTDAIAVNGSFRAETIQINAQGVQVTGSRTTTFSNLENLTVNGNGGSDNITVNASVTTTGSTVTSSSLTQIQVNGGLDNDTLNVSSVLSSTNVTVAGNEGNDTIKLGNTNNTLNQIAGGVTIDGGTGTDTTLVNNQGATTNQTGNITATTITGFGLGTKGITYSNTEDLQINLGSGADTVTINGTQKGKTTINTNGGDDSVTVNSIGGQTLVNVGAGNDNLFTKVALSAAGLAFSDPEKKTPTLLSSNNTPILPTTTATTTTTKPTTSSSGTTTTIKPPTQPGITSSNIISPTSTTTTTGTTTTTKTATTTKSTTSTKTTIQPPTQPGITTTTITSPTATTNTTSTQTGIISSLINKITGIFSK
jgi:Domain of unknown function (DUF4347)